MAAVQSQKASSPEAEGGMRGQSGDTDTEVEGRGKFILPTSSPALPPQSPKPQTFLPLILPNHPPKYYLLPSTIFYFAKSMNHLDKSFNKDFEGHSASSSIHLVTHSLFSTKRLLSTFCQLGG